MESGDAPISLNLNAPVASASPDTAVPVEQLQFRRAEPVGAPTASKRCAACKSAVYDTYFQAAGHDICPACAARIQSGQQAPPAHSLFKAALYGGGAAIAGCALYAFVSIAANLQLALLAILIGYMVGRAIRHASNGLGGRHQQILAVLLTYFSITFSYVVVLIYEAGSKHAPSAQQSGAAGTAPTAPRPTAPRKAAPMNPGTVVAVLAGLAAIAPFLALGSNPVGGLISLVIIFVGLRQAWRMTGRSDIPIFGPYNVAGTP
jgi:hypothetical protein